MLSQILEDAEAAQAAYEESVVDNAIERMLNYATDLVNTAKGSLGARDSYTAAELGLRLDEVLKDYDDIMAALNGQSDKIEEVKNNPNPDKTAAMATLNEVNNTLTEINGNIAEFTANVDAIKKAVKANNDQKTAADKAVALRALQSLTRTLQETRSLLTSSRLLLRKSAPWRVK